MPPRDASPPVRNSPGHAGIADAIVVAAGSSSRMGGLDKVAAPLLGKPLLAWTVSAIASAPEIARIVVVGPESLAAIARGASTKVVAVVPGGRRRQESVASGFAGLAGVDTIEDARPILVHDGARPLVTPTLVSEVVVAVITHGAAIPVVPVVETLKRVTGDRIAETVDRTGIVAAQTPQGARAGLLRRAWAEFPPDGPLEFTDEAALLEACRIPVHPIPGDHVNLKVTLPADLARAEASLAARPTPLEPGRAETRAPEVRTGFGFDTHGFGSGTPLRLGGITIGGAPALHGHSDGDVALHAIADALLGAVGQGDLGRTFPADPRTPRGIASSELLAAVVARLAGSGWAPASIDVTIVGARPRLGGRLDEMRESMAALVGIDAARVSVKASTGNLEGSEGAGRAISAHAIAVVRATEARR